MTHAIAQERFWNCAKETGSTALLDSTHSQLASILVRARDAGILADAVEDDVLVGRWMITWNVLNNFLPQLKTEVFGAAAEMERGEPQASDGGHEDDAKGTDTRAPEPDAQEDDHAPQSPGTAKGPAEAARSVPAVIEPAMEDGEVTRMSSTAATDPASE